MKKIELHIAAGALWMMILILSLPMAAAQESALFVTRFSGNDEVEGAVRGLDTLQIEAKAKVTGEETISKDQVRIFINGEFNSFFSNCQAPTGDDTFWTCTYSESITGTGGSGTYDIKLFTDAGTEFASVTRDLVVDGTNPVVTTLTVTPTATSTGDVTVTWDAEDYGTTVGDTVNCIGLQKVAFTVGSKTIHTKEIVGNNVCTFGDTFDYSHSTGKKQEDVVVCAIATDKFGQTSIPECVEFTYDADAPAANEVVIRDKQGTKIDYAKSQRSVTVDIAITIPGDDVVSVSADFSRLVTSGWENIAYNEQQGDSYIWRNVPVSQWSDCTIGVTPEDAAGNQPTQQISCGVIVDDTGPQVRSMITDHVLNATYYVGTNTTITATIIEGGVGLNNSNIFLNGFNLGIGTQVKADECAPSTGNAWTCTWFVTALQETGAANLVISPNSEDDLGNKLTQSDANSLDVQVDKVGPSPPVILNHTIIHSEFDYGDVVVRGDTLEWYVQSADFDFATANFSGIGGDDNVAGECAQSNTSAKTCFFTSPVTASGPGDVSVTFIFKDITGNTATVSDEFFLFGLSDDPNPNYFTTSVHCSPESVDRATAGLVPVKTYCEIKFEPIAGTDAKAIGVELGDISQCSGTTSGYITDINLINTVAPVENNEFEDLIPYLAVTLETSEFKEIDTIDFSCPIFVSPLIGQNLTAFPEQEDVNVTLNIYNMPLGELHKARDAKIQDAVDEAKDYLSWVGALQKLFRYAEMICNLINVWFNLLTTISTVSLLFGKTADATSGIPFIGTSIEKSAEADCITSESLRQSVSKKVYGDGKGFGGMLHKFCDFITCRTGLGDVLGKDGGIGVISDEKATALKSIPESVWGALGGNLLGGKDLGEYPGDPRATINVKESMFWSVMHMCVPGIIYNLDKLRQIQCRYATCLRDDVKQGFPESACEDMKSYLTCRYWASELFHAFPLTAMVDYYAGLIKNAISDPLQFIGTLSGVLLQCRDKCLVPASPAGTKSAGISGCLILKALSSLGQSIKDIQGILKGDTFKVGDDWCEDLEEDDDEET